MDEAYALCYRDLYERHWWWRARERYIIDSLRRHTPRGWGRILDVGCGDGLFFDRLAELGEVEGVDPGAEPAGRWASRIHIAPFDAAFDPGRRYSLVLFLDVLEHLERPEEALLKARTLLDPGGSVLITVPAFPQLWTRHDDLNRHRARYTIRTLGELLHSTGFEVTEARYFFHWLAVAKLVVHGAESIARRKPVPPRVPARPLNRALELSCMVEARLLGPLNLPFGSSLMAFARPRG